MIILGIDPGPTDTAYVLFDGQKVIETAYVPSDEMLSVVKGIQPDDLVVACEHLQCFGMAVGKEVFETAYYIGAIRQICLDRGIPFHRVYRSEEKMTLCQNMRAKDGNIRQAILDRFGGKDVAIGKKALPGALYGISGDRWSALAVAITHFEKHKQPTIA